MSTIIQALENIIGTIPPGYKGIAWVMAVPVLLFVVHSVVRILGAFMSIFTGWRLE